MNDILNNPQTLQAAFPTGMVPNSTGTLRSPRRRLEKPKVDGGLSDIKVKQKK